MDKHSIDILNEQVDLVKKRKLLKAEYARTLEELDRAIGLKNLEYWEAKAKEYREQCGDPNVEIGNKLLVYEGCWLISGKFRYDHFSIGEILLLEQSVLKTYTVIKTSGDLRRGHHVPYEEIQKMYLAYVESEL